MADSTGLPAKDFFRVREVAEYFGVSDRTVYGWIYTAAIMSVKIGGCRFITRDSIIDAVQNGTSDIGITVL